MVAVPADTPTTIPAEPTTAALLPELQVPPVVASLSNSSLPAHTVVPPVMAGKEEETVTIFITAHPVPNE